MNQNQKNSKPFPFDQTPAPWGCSALPALSADWFSITDAHGTEVARVPHITGETPKKTRERAALLAAAPELLEALKSAELSTVQIRMVADIGDKTLRGKIAWYEGQLEQLRDELRAAISKAEGQA